MTWRVCSPPWPGRENPGSWPGRRQCGLPSAGPPLRSASHPLPGGPYGTDGPGGLSSRSRARLATALVVTVAGLGSVLAAYTDLLPSPIQQVAHVAVAAPAPHRTGSLPSTTTSRARRAHATLQPTSRPGPRPSHSPAPRSAPATGRGRRRTFRRPSGLRPIVAPLGRPAAPVWGTRRFRRRRHRAVPDPGHSRCIARAASRGPRASPPSTRSLPDLRQPQLVGVYQGGTSAGKARIVTTEA